MLPSPFEIRRLEIPTLGQTVDTVTVQAADLLNAEIFTDEVNSLETFLTHLDNESTEGYALLQQTGRLVGAATAEITPEYTFLASIAVTEQDRRQGHASRLLRHIAMRAVAVGSPLVELYENTPAPAFYAKFGFHKSADGLMLAAPPQDILSR